MLLKEEEKGEPILRVTFLSFAPFFLSCHKSKSRVRKDHKERSKNDRDTQVTKRRINMATV